MPVWVKEWKEWENGAVICTVASHQQVSGSNPQAGVEFRLTGHRFECEHGLLSVILCVPCNRATACPLTSVMGPNPPMTQSWKNSWQNRWMSCLDLNTKYNWLKNTWLDLHPFHNITTCYEAFLVESSKHISPARSYLHCLYFHHWLVSIF